VSALVVSALVVLGNAGLQLYLGSRAAAAMPVVAYAWLWHRSVRRLPTLILLGGALVLVGVVFPAVVMVRFLAGPGRMAPADVAARYLSIQNPVAVAVAEMGLSLRTVAYTLQMVPAQRGFEWGMSYLYALTTICPNLFWPIHPAVARGLAADWLIKTVAPALAAQGQGFGYSFIAEAYLNGGWVGAPAILALMGYLYARFVLWALNSRCPARMATLAAFLSFFLLFARGESASFVRPLVWYALLPYAVVRLGAWLWSRREGDRSRQVAGVASDGEQRRP